MNKKEVMLVIASFALILCLLSFTSAIAVNSPYWYENEKEGIEEIALKMAPGESKIISLDVPNEEDSNVTIKIIIESGEEIISLEKTKYNISSGSRVDVPMEITLPRDIEIGEELKVSLKFESGALEEGGTVSFGSGVLISFPVKAVEKTIEKGEKEGTSQLLILGIVVLIIVILIVVFFKKPKKGSKKKK
jgi:hypothetical protein